MGWTPAVRTRFWPWNRCGRRSLHATQARGDLAFLLHMLAVTNTQGMVGVVMPHGVVDEAIEQTRQERDGLQLLKASTADALLTGRVRVGGSGEG